MALEQLNLKTRESQLTFSSIDRNKTIKPALDPVLTACALGSRATSEFEFDLDSDVS